MVGNTKKIKMINKFINVFSKNLICPWSSLNESRLSRHEKKCIYFLKVIPIALMMIFIPYWIISDLKDLNPFRLIVLIIISDFIVSLLISIYMTFRSA
jgi:hypothetical protein